MNRELIYEESKKMVEDFNENFFIPYLDKIDHQMDISANIVLSFACSAFLSLVLPILCTGQDPKKTIDDANGILNDMRLQMQKHIKAVSAVKKNFN